MPQRAETQGRSEEYVGRWMKERKIPRDHVVLATKVFLYVYLICNENERCDLAHLFCSNRFGVVFSMLAVEQNFKSTRFESVLQHCLYMSAELKECKRGSL